MDQVLLLDIGGVVLRSGHEMMALLGRRRPELAGETDRRGHLGPLPDPRWEMALAGTLAERAYWAERAAALGALTGGSTGIPALMSLLYDEDALGTDGLVRPEARALMRDAAADGRTVAALTNDLAAFHEDADLTRHPLFSLFDPLVDLSSAGVLKPDPGAYARALSALGDPDPADVVFLDDMPANVAGARAAGLTTVWVDLEDPGAAFAQARDLLSLAVAA
ncbi:HAD-IA family hydrolase [Actinomycetospora sp. CA-101289]|uniref:HAD-IA family hydrolase n=1 Tax=Actinomycetospora sp. CA-101289 TaxID=3239893 RepID=UPI003D9613B5